MLLVKVELKPPLFDQRQSISSGNTNLLSYVARVCLTLVSFLFKGLIVIFLGGLGWKLAMPPNLFRLFSVFTSFGTLKNNFIFYGRVLLEKVL